MRRTRFVVVQILIAVGLCQGILGCVPETPSSTATNCPQPTPENLWVEPVASPTDRHSQVVTVHMGNTEVVTITAESGVFTASGEPARVLVDLRPDTVHHLKVVARVREVQDKWGCIYGGYTLQTSRDKSGAPLVIEQGSPAPGQAGAQIGPENAAQLAPLLAFTPAARLTTDFVFRNSSELLSSGYADHIAIWNVATAAEIGRIGDGLEEAGALTLALDSAGEMLASGGTADDPSVRLWDPGTGEMKLLGVPNHYPESLAFSPSGALLASGDSGNTVTVWDLETAELLATLEGDIPNQLQSFHSLYWPDETTLVGAGSDAIYWWDISEERVLQRIERPEKAVFFVEAAVSPGNERLAAVAQDDAVYLLRPGDEMWARWPAGKGDRLNHISFSPDDRLLAATTAAGELLLWDLDAEELLARHSITSGDIAVVRFSPDGRSIAVGGWDSPIWILGVPR